MFSNVTEYQVKMTMTGLNIGIVGPAGSGKSAFILRWTTGQFIRQHHPVNLTCSVNIPTTMANFICNLVETSDLASLEEMDGFILFFDRSNSESFAAIPEYLQTLKDKFPSAPIILCGNKVDIKSREVTPQEIRQVKGDCLYFDFSSKSNYNFEKPLLFLLRSVLFPNDDYETLKTRAVNLLEFPALEPPAINL